MEAVMGAFEVERGLDMRFLISAQNVESRPTAYLTVVALGLCDILVPTPAL